MKNQNILQFVKARLSFFKNTNEVKSCSGLVSVLEPSFRIKRRKTGKTVESFVKDD